VTADQEKTKERRFGKKVLLFQVDFGSATFLEAVRSLRDKLLTAEARRRGAKRWENKNWGRWASGERRFKQTGLAVGPGPCGKTNPGPSFEVAWEMRPWLNC